MGKRKFIYKIKLLGVYGLTDGEPCLVSRDGHVEWMTENCKGKWQYDSPDVKAPPFNTKKPNRWPTFFTMWFSFSRKTDYDLFQKTFC